MDNNLVRIAAARKSNPAILKPYSLQESAAMDNIINESDLKSMPDYFADLRSLDINADSDRNILDDGPCLLLNDEEKVCVTSSSDFMKLLKIPNNIQGVKVVSIFGNTGEGKSYTLNQVFFDGAEVFRTSVEQVSCTLGVWAAYDGIRNVIVLDTEGLLGVTRKESQRTRLLLKVLAISDVVVYRTRAERLQRDMYTFLGGASKAYKDHFQTALQQIFQAEFVDSLPPRANAPCLSMLGPSCVIFHETRHTNTLQSSAGVIDSPEDILRQRFAELQLDSDSFSSLRYIGVQSKDGPTSFTELRNVLERELENTTVRSKRSPKIIYRTLRGLNEKFSGEIKNTPPQLYLKEYFTCQVKCQSCNEGCCLSMGHKEEGQSHFSNSNCKFQHQFQNCVYLCRNCFKNGQRIIVKPSYQSITDNSWSNLFNYVWTGYIIECRKCGEIYRSRQHWFGNKCPEEVAVVPEIVHIWPGERNYMGSNYSAQKVIDGVNAISSYVTSVGTQSTKHVAAWTMDKIAPEYWRPNNEITECYKCHQTFSSNASKHHCRACGEGFCEQCSSRSQPVPYRGWLQDVRVCDDCYRPQAPSLSTASPDADTEIRVRRYGEAVASSLSAVASVLEIPKTLIKDTARPEYWTPDVECLSCECCRNPFGILIALHHCRDCGKGVCDDCSATRKVVPLRGWHYPVRVCDNCLKK